MAIFTKRRSVVLRLLCAIGLIILFFYFLICDKERQWTFNDLYELHPPKNSSERIGNVWSKCGKLYDIAKDMLNGEKIKLPFEKGQSKWHFHDESDLDLLAKTSLRWNYQRNASQEFINVYKNAKSRDIKSKKYFITFASNCCNTSKLKAIMHALYPGGFDHTTIHDLNSLSRGFRKTYAHILNQERGSGYWLWKPYIILKTLVENLKDGDLLMYQDAGAYLIKDAGPLLKLSEDVKYGILLFYVTLWERHYTKRDAFVLMGMDDSRVYKTFQRLASFMVLRRNCKSLQFVMEWLAYASNLQLITDTNRKMQGKKVLPGFKEHRHDQSVLSLLSKKWGLYAYRTPSQYGNPLGYNGGPYDQLIFHHRNRN